MENLERTTSKLLAAALFVSGAMAASPEPVPEVIWDKGSGREEPLWVSREAAELDDGSIDWDLLGPHARSLYESIDAEFLPGPITDAASGRTPECLQYGPSGACYAQASPSMRGLDAYVQSVAETVVGTVRGTKAGFFEGEPATLLQVEVHSFLEKDRDPELAVPQVVYIAHPRATFRVGETAFCKRDPAFPGTPQSGDVVAFFSHYGPFETATSYTFDRWAGQMLWLSGTGTVAMDHDLERLFLSRSRGAASGELYLEELEASIRKAQAGRTRGGGDR